MGFMRQNVLVSAFQDQTLSAIHDTEQAYNIIYPKVLYFLKHNPHKLFNILYRIDVAENRVRECFALKEDSRIASAIAGLIIEREQQKAISREKYSS